MPLRPLAFVAREGAAAATGAGSGAARSSVSATALAPLAVETGVPVLYDFGSGLMLDLSAWGLTGEPTARDAVRSGAALVMMSGDKLLGGPQAGIIVGRADMMDALRRNPLARALRVDKLTLSALEATLMLYREPERAVREIPALAMLTASVESLVARAEVLLMELQSRGITTAIVETEATVGGGAFPTARIPSIALALNGASASKVQARLREAPVPVVGRITNGRVLLDLRGVLPDTEPLLLSAIASALT
jgi:L-seryl-tRNA(Ser) seleniumtransferase